MEKEGLTSLKRESTRREQILFALVFLAVITAFFRLVYAPAKGRLSGLHSKGEALQLERDALRKFQVATPRVTLAGRSKNVKVKVLTGDIRSDMTELTVLVPKLTEPSFLGALSLTGFSFLGTTPHTGFDSADFVLKMNGSFASLVEYLERAETFPALFRIQDLLLKMEKEGKEAAVEVTGRLFRLQKGEEKT